MRLTHLTPLLLSSLVASIAVPPSPASSSDGSIAPVTAAPSIPTATLAAPAAPTDGPLDEVDDLELRAIVTAAPAAQPTPAAVPAGAAGPAPFITSWWAPTVLPDGATTWVQLVFTQTYNAVPEQLPTPNKGVVGMGTLTGEVGVVRTSVPKYKNGGGRTEMGWRGPAVAAGLAVIGAVGMVW
ncbi:hypothetical protein W97_08748 [Coniosporium apollinis CBS 100218]|uniref:Uncharacterized protein n=1 Tax=Coniosporium apollinis (strain CBS 100218) TaxID=1168221 RepID=R7Z5V6_CONA1|nr:uncharacterized protein W97_08748 [Coniosporium apollinis CBS 100218]EON69488.1 hypothetical protein W97_08748 [Coniosporium apollinis CBS 100218]